MIAEAEVIGEWYWNLEERGHPDWAGRALFQADGIGGAVDHSRAGSSAGAASG